MSENQINRPEAQEFPFPLSVETRNKLAQAKREISDEIVSLYAQYNIPITIPETYSLSIDKKSGNDGFRDFYILGVYDYNTLHRTYLFDLVSKKLVCQYSGINSEDNVILGVNNPTRFEENLTFIYKTYKASNEFQKNQKALKRGIHVEEIEKYFTGQ